MLESFVRREKPFTISEIGMDKEQIKSVFYARSLPITKSGRLKPILHLVKAHKRRIKEGADVDINRHIRGIDSVKIGDLVFSIRPPSVDCDLQKRWL